MGSQHGACMNEDVVRDTHELERSTLRLLLTTKLEARRIINTKILASDIEGKYTHCLQRFKESCILYLQTVHSRRRTTFLVVFAFLWKTGLV